MDSSDIFQDEEQGARLRAEADFGLREVRPFFSLAEKPKTVLEVGCGTGYLLTRMAEEFDDISFTGVEPIGPGFTQFEKALDTVEKKYENITFIRQRIEDVEIDKKYDLIYSINVFEHLDDWREAIDICVSMLNPNGQLVVLCPNYSIPYESHFALPIFGTKSFTHKIFSRQIEQLEDRFDAKGLWQSLNFIKVPQVRKYCELKGYDLSFDTDIMARMLDRLDEDPEFRKRQSALARLAIIANRLGAGSLLSTLPARCGAYMKVVVRA